jgi:lipopolysaccharide export system protein LptA
LIKFTFVLILWGLPLWVQAQGTGILPFSLEAGDGVEWIQAEQLYRAKGGAVLVYQGWTLKAPTIEAGYSMNTGRIRITHARAYGGVTITGLDGSSAQGQALAVDVAQQTAVLSGNPKLTHPRGVLTAADRLTLSLPQKQAVAIGGVTLTAPEGTLRAQTMTAQFSGATEKQLRLEHIKAQGQVYLSQNGRKGTADEAIWYPQTGQASLKGRVRLEAAQGHFLEGGQLQLNKQQGTAILTNPGGRVQGGYTVRERE